MGAPHIVSQGTNLSIRYSTKVGSVWTAETIPGGVLSDGNTEGACALVLDATNAAHVAVATLEGEEEELYATLNYFTNENGSWQQREPYSCTYGYVVGADIAIDSSGMVGISFGINGFDCANGVASVWFCSEPSWTLQRVDGSPPSTGARTSVAFDALGQPHMCYGLMDGTLRYSVRAAGVWQSEIVEDPYSSGARFPSIAVDESGAPHIAYYDPRFDDLIYARRSSEGWTKEIVDSQDDVGRYASMSLNAAGEPHITYRFTTGGDLRYAFKRGGQWMISVVDTTADTGWFSSLSLDFTGAPRVAYQSSSPTTLRYARVGSVVDPEPTTVGLVTNPAFALLVSPNPSRIGHTRIQLAASRNEAARIEVFDVTGRHVRTLLSGAAPLGGWNYVWDGLDARARSVAVGTYLINAEIGGAALTKQIRVVR